MGGARGGGGGGGGGPPLPNAGGLSARHMQFSRMILDTSNHVLRAYFKCRWRTVVTDYKEKWQASHPLPPWFAETWGDTTSSWKSFEWMFRDRGLEGMMQQVCRNGGEAKVLSGDTSVWDTSIFFQFLQTHYPNSTTLGDYRLAKLRNPFYRGRQQHAIHFLKECRNELYAHLTNTNADRFLVRGINLTFEQVQETIVEHLELFAKQVEPHATGPLHEYLAREIQATDAIRVLTSEQLKELKAIRDANNPEALRTSDVTNLIKLVQNKDQTESQSINKSHILVFGRVGNDNFDTVKKLWKDLEAKDERGLEQQDVVNVIQERLKKAAGAGQGQDAALLEFLTKDARWVGKWDSSKEVVSESSEEQWQGKWFQTDSDWKRLKSRAFCKDPEQIRKDKWMHATFQEVNRRAIHENLHPKGPVDPSNVPRCYGDLIEGKGTYPAREATTFRPWEKKLNWRGVPSHACGLSRIHATIRFVEGTARVIDDDGIGKFVLEEAAAGCFVDVLDKSLRKKADTAAGVAQAPNFYLLEDGDILRFHHGRGIYSMLGMVRIRIVIPDQALAAGGDHSATNPTALPRETLFAEALSEDAVAAIERENDAKESRREIKSLKAQIMDQGSMIEGLHANMEQLMALLRGHFNIPSTNEAAVVAGGGGGGGSSNGDATSVLASATAHDTQGGAGGNA